LTEDWREGGTIDRRADRKGGRAVNLISGVRGERQFDWRGIAQSVRFTSCLEGKKVRELGDDRISDRDKEEGGRMARGLSGVESMDCKGWLRGGSIGP
jgi:hypothetical protein